MSSRIGLVTGSFVTGSFGAVAELAHHVLSPRIHAAVLHDDERVVPSAHRVFHGVAPSRQVNSNHAVVLSLVASSELPEAVISPSVHGPAVGPREVEPVSCADANDAFA